MLFPEYSGLLKMKCVKVTIYNKTILKTVEKLIYINVTFAEIVDETAKNRNNNSQSDTQ